jgi:solute carrier family 13 (sodium-dependent dicarboxylate transporter), member 2/3/5
MKIKELFFLLIIPVGCIGGFILFPPVPEKPVVGFMLAIAIIMAIWWITEIVPLAVTSLLPVALFPLFGIMDGQSVSSTYFNHVIFLFLGGFLVALAMQKWNLHRRIALVILLITGSGPGNILLGFMIATAFLSMWISNTATAMMMVPILISITEKLEEQMGAEKVQKFSVGLLIAVAYSASIGGIATLVGTPPNLSFARIFQIYFPDAPEITFANWFFFAFPLSVIIFTVTWLYLYFIFKPKKGDWIHSDKNTFREQLTLMGKMKYEEKVVLIHFLLLALLWLFRADISVGAITIPGWSDLFPSGGFINDGTVAVLISISLFAFKAKQLPKSRIMEWQTASKLPWNIILLFGGGFALAAGFKESGLSVWIGQNLAGISVFPPIVIIFSIAILMTFLTELTSNTATTEMILPILAGIAVSTSTNPLLFMIPATLSASMAFMLPVATPPNAIVFGTNRLKISQMAKNGLLLNIIVAIIITLLVQWLGGLIFGIDADIFPEWAAVH